MYTSRSNNLYRSSVDLTLDSREVTAMISTACLIAVLALVPVGQAAAEDGGAAAGPLIAGVDGVTNPESLSRAKPTFPPNLRATQADCGYNVSRVG